MAQQKRPKGMSKKTYDFLVDLSFIHEEIEVIWRMIFNDVCKAYNVSQKTTAKSIKKTAKKTTKKTTAKKATPNSYYDGKDWVGTEPRSNITWRHPTYGDIELCEGSNKKEKDQIPVASLIKDEAKKIEQQANAARRKSIIEGSEKKESEESDELPRKAKGKRRGAW
jgi:hypothetical protein